MTRESSLAAPVLPAVLDVETLRRAWPVLYGGLQRLHVELLPVLAGARNAESWLRCQPERFTAAQVADALGLLHQWAADVAQNAEQALYGTSPFSPASALSLLADAPPTDPADVAIQEAMRQATLAVLQSRINSSIDADGADAPDRSTRNELLLSRLGFCLALIGDAEFYQEVGEVYHTLAQDAQATPAAALRLLLDRFPGPVEVASVALPPAGNPM